MLIGNFCQQDLSTAQGSVSHEHPQYMLFLHMIA